MEEKGEEEGEEKGEDERKEEGEEEREGEGGSWEMEWKGDKAVMQGWLLLEDTNCIAVISNTSPESFTSRQTASLRICL